MIGCYRGGTTGLYFTTSSRLPERNWTSRNCVSRTSGPIGLPTPARGRSRQPSAHGGVAGWRGRVPDLTVGWWIAITIAVSVIALVIGTGVLALITPPVSRVWQDNPIRHWWGRRRAETDAPRLLRAI